MWTSFWILDGGFRLQSWAVRHFGSELVLILRLIDFTRVYASAHNRSHNTERSVYCSRVHKPSPRVHAFNHVLPNLPEFLKWKTLFSHNHICRYSGVLRIIRLLEEYKICTFNISQIFREKTIQL